MKKPPYPAIIITIFVFQNLLFGITRGDNSFDRIAILKDMEIRGIDSLIIGYFSSGKVSDNEWELYSISYHIGYPTDSYLTPISKERSTDNLKSLINGGVYYPNYDSRVDTVNAWEVVVRDTFINTSGYDASASLNFKASKFMVLALQSASIESQYTNLEYIIYNEIQLFELFKEILAQSNKNDLVSNYSLLIKDAKLDLENCIQKKEKYGKLSGQYFLRSKKLQSEAKLAREKATARDLDDLLK